MGGGAGTGRRAGHLRPQTPVPRVSPQCWQGPPPSAPPAQCQLLTVAAGSRVLLPQPWPDQLLRGDSSCAQVSSSAGSLTQALEQMQPLAESPILSPPHQKLLSVVRSPCSPARAKPFPLCPSPGHCRPSLNDHYPLCSPASEPAQASGRQPDTSVCRVPSFPTHIHSVAL